MNGEPLPIGRRPKPARPAFYLHSKGKANTREGNGSLTMRPPAAGEPEDEFEADPAKSRSRRTPERRSTLAFLDVPSGRQGHSTGS